MDDGEINVEELLCSGDFSSIILGLSHEFKCNSPIEKKLERLDEVIKLYCKGNHYKEASELISKLHSVDGNLKFHLLEYDLLVRHNDNDEDAVNNILMELYENQDKLEWYPWTSEICGLWLIDILLYEDALLILNRALNKALKGVTEEDEEYASCFRKHITRAETALAAIENERQLEEEWQIKFDTVKARLSTADFNSIISDLSEEFKRESTPEEAKSERLLSVIDLYLDGKHFNEALELIKKLISVAPYLKNVLREFELLVRHRADDDDGVTVILNQLEEHKDEMFRFDWTLDIYGSHLLKKQRFEPYLVLYNNALKITLEYVPAEDRDKKYKEYITDLKEHIDLGEKLRNKFEKQKQEKEKIRNNEEHKVEEKSVDDLVKEIEKLDQAKPSREKKKKKPQTKKSKGHEERKKKEMKGNDDTIEEASKFVEDDLEGKKDVKKEEMKGKDDTIKEASKFDLFESPFTFRVQYLDDDECFLAFVKMDTTTVRKSIVKAQSIQIDNCQELVNICSRHESLVAVQHAVKLGGTDYLMTEEIASIKKFFGLKYQEYRPNTIQEWWLKIHDIFKILFRDIVRGLMFLFENQYSCGNVSFNVFVKDDGRGKILPSMKSSSKKEMREDLRQLIQTMKTVITFQFPQHEDLHSFLPHDLMSLFDFVKNADSEWNDVPILFLADHPYFWSISEKIEFTFKTRKFIKKSDSTTTKINLSLKNLHFFDNWKDKLTGVYLAVWKYSEKKKRPYRLNVDIVRYFGAVFTRVNERDYKQERKNKRIADEDIEEALLCFFPDYYISLFKGFCSCRQRGAISNEELMEVSGICHRST